MIVNGVTLPDIPEYILEQNPYVVVIGMSAAEGGMTMMVTSKSPFVAVPPGMTVDEQTYDFYYVASTVTENFAFFLSGEEWTEGGRSSSFTFPVNTVHEGATVELLYTNHDIYVASAFDDITNLGTAGTQLFCTATQLETPPTRYSIAKAILDAVARQIMRLTDSTAKVKPEEFEPKLEGINIQLQELTVTATEEVQTITPPSGVYGFSKVIVEAVESSGGAGSGGEGDDAGDTSDTLLIESSKIFGYEWNYATSLYNGVLLPNPINWPYLLVYNTGTQYYINGANAPFVLDNGSLRTSDGSRCAVGTVTRKTALDANALSSVSWNMTFSESGYATKGKTLAVANHEVINKSNGSTYISPTGEIVASGEGVFAALPSDARYIVKKTTLDRLAFHIQKKMGTSAKLSVVDIDAYLDGL